MGRCRQRHRLQEPVCVSRLMAARVFAEKERKSEQEKREKEKRERDRERE